MTRRQALPRLRFQSWAHALGHWVLDSQRDVFVLDTPYQRGQVWTPEQKVSMMESLLRGLPVGTIITNKREHGHLQYIVDGVQRISAARSFVDDEFAVPAWWFEDDELTVPADGGVLYSQLSETGRRRLWMLPMPSLEAAVDTVEEEAHIFDLINTAGTPQTSETIAAARRIAGAAR